MKAISLFSGAGGMDVGFKKAGFDIATAIDLDKHACGTFRANHPETNLVEGDIAECQEELLAYDPVDVVFGGPPCQGFSVNGKMDPCDPRSALVFSFCKAVELIRPSAFVMENVKALGTLARFKQTRAALVSLFHQAGYSVTMFILQAKDYGVPQSRERVFFVGFRDPIQPLLPQSLHRYTKAAPSVREAIAFLGKPGTNTNPHTCNARITLAANPVLRRSPYAGMLFNGGGRPICSSRWAKTLPASMGGNRTPIIDDDEMYKGDTPWVETYHQHLLAGGRVQDMREVPARLRRLTITEAALLQSFPKDYIWRGPSSKIYAQIGNAVPCQLAYTIACGVRDAIESSL